MGPDFLFVCPIRAAPLPWAQSGVLVCSYDFLPPPSADPSDPWPFCKVYWL